MENLKIKVENEAESKEVQDLFFELGYAWNSCSKCYLKLQTGYKHISAYFSGMRLAMGNGLDTKKEITLPELRDMVVLKRNDPKDATHYRNDGKEYYVNSSGTRSYYMVDDEWTLTKWDEDQLKTMLKPIDKKMKEYLDKDYVLRQVKQTGGDNRVPDGWIDVPEGADIARKMGSGRIEFFKCDGVFYYNTTMKKWRKATVNTGEVVWKRETLNDQVASAEAYRQEEVLPMLDIEFPSEQEIKDEGLNRGDVNYRVAKAFNEIRGTDLTEDDIDYLRKFIDLTNSHYGV